MEELLDEPGPVSLERVTSAKGTSPRSGLINLKHVRARHLEEGAEPVQVYFHAINPPTRGLYVLGPGLETALGNPEHPARTSVTDGAVLFTGDVCHTAWG